MTESISIIGAGSRRCANAVLAAIMHLGLSADSELVLCDVHAEALDLFDRLARTYADESDNRFLIRCEPSVGEALKSSTITILTFGIGEEHIREFAVPADANDEIMELVRAMRMVNLFERINENLHKSSEIVKVINLVRPTRLTACLCAASAVHLDWPPQMTEAEKMSAVHQALRWVRTDDYPQFELKNHADSPLLKAITEYETMKTNSFDPRALAKWVQRLDFLQDGLGTALLQR